MNKPMSKSEIQSQAEWVSSDLIRADLKKKALRKKLLIGLVATVVSAGAGTLTYEILLGARYVSTDNAYVGADVAHVTPLIDAPVAEVRVTDTDFVKKGDVLVVLDDADE